MDTTFSSGRQLAEAELTKQARLRSYGVPLAACVEPSLAHPPDLLLRAVANVVGRAVRRLIDTGWRPVDMTQVRARRLDAVAGACLYDVLGEVTDADARLRTDPAWSAELREVVAAEPAGTPRPRLTSGVSDARWSLGETAGIALDLLAQIAFWPALANAAPVAMTGDAREAAMLVKVRALLAKAERTEFEHEAEAFTAKAQELMARHSVDEAMLGAARANPTAGAALQRIWLDAPYVRPKFSIVHAVAAANHCQALLNDSLDVASVVGMAADVRATVLLATSLQLQAARALARARPDHDDGWGPSVKTYRRSFLLAFAARIGERLREATTTVESGVDLELLLPVLADRKAVVERAVKEAFPLTRPMRRTAAVDPSGWAAGRAAADLARLGSGEALRGSA